MIKVNQFIRNWINPDKSIILFCLTLLIIVWSGVLWQIDQDEKTTLEMLRRDGDRLARAFEEHVCRVLKVNEQYLILLKDNYETANGVTQSTQHLMNLLGRDQLVIQLGLLGADGHQLMSLRHDPTRTDYFQTPLFKAHVSTDTGQYVLDQSSIGLLNNEWSVPLSVRLNKPDGSFAGAAYVSINLDYFNKFYWGMNFNEDYVIRIVGRDGFVRVSSKNSEIGANMNPADLWIQLEQAPSGFYRSRGSFYGKPLLMSYRALPDYPVIVQVGVSESVLAPMIQRGQFYLGAAGAVSIFILLFGGGMIARARRNRQADERLKQNEERLRTFVTNTPIIFYAMDGNGIFTLSEGLGLKKIGLEAGQAVGHSALEMYRDYPDIMDALRRSLKGEAVFFEHQVGDVYLNNRMVPLFNEKGQVVSIVGAALDITERVQAENSIKESYKELAAAHEELIATEEEVRNNYNELSNERAFSSAVLESVPGLLYLYDIQGRLIRWNKNHETATGYSAEELSKMTLADWYKGDQETFERVYGEVAKAFKEGMAFAEADLQNKDGSKTPYYFTAVKIIIDNLPYFVGIGIDITEQKKAQAGLVEKEKELRQSLEELTVSHEELVAQEEELRDLFAKVVAANERLEYLRNKDQMTGVYNRTYFETDIVRLQSSEPWGVGMFVCDVDGLKLINDTLGHRQGDELLKAVAQILDSGIQKPEYVARIGGDEFAVVLVETTKLRMEELERFYRTKIINYNKENPHLPLSLSLGWALETEPANMEVVFKTADNNMYRQKMHQRQSVRGSIVQIMMKALEEKDHITEGHADRVGELMELMGCKLMQPQSTVADLRLLAKFHDIGKVGISDSILKKPGKLTEDEMVIMRQHCEIGFRIAKSSPVLEPIADWILKHHEHWDGGGYPLGISGEDIPIQCRILGIVDAFDAMTSDRPYRKAMPIGEALAELSRCAGTQFDPQLVDIFISIMEGSQN